MSKRQAWIFLNQESEPESPDDHPVDLSAPRLTGRLGIMTLKQLQRIAGRFSPGLRITRKHAAVQEIQVVLNSPDLLARLYAGLAPMERLILQLLKRRGGRASGWEIYTGAILRGARPDGQLQTGSLEYRYWSKPAAAVEYLQQMAADGLLLFPDLIDVDSFGHAGDETITADESLLAHLPAEPLAPVRKLDLPEQPAEAMEGRHPAAVVLELLDILQLTAGEGGLDVTRSGTIAKPFLRRIEKQRPHLKGKLEWLLRLLPAMDLIRPPLDGTIKQPWQVNADRLTAFLQLPFTYMYASIVDASAAVSDEHVDRHWDRAISDGVSSREFWAATLQSLATLPEHAVNSPAAATLLWQEVMEPVFAPPGGLPAYRKPPVVAITRMLNVIMPQLALLSHAPGAADADSTRIAPGPGTATYLRARAIVEGGSEVSAAALHRAETELEASGPALLIQPDFSVLVYLDRLTAASVRALMAAGLERLDLHTATFRIDRSSVTYGLGSGADVNELIRRLAAHAHEVPANVIAAMTDWAARRDRLRVHVSAQLIEYPGPEERDAALPAFDGARPLAERFILLDSDRPALDSGFDYSYPADYTLEVDGTGLIKVLGPLDLPARKLLKSVTDRVSTDEFRINPEKVRSGAFNAQLQEVLALRTLKQLPRALEVMLKAWSGQTPPPAFNTVSLFQHPEASSWAEHPGIGKLLGQKLNASTYLLKPGSEADLKKLLDELGISHATGEAAAAAEAETVSTDTLEAGLSTRKTRELVERAIQYGQQLELRYAYERRDGTRGKVRTEQLTPEEVVYRGSTPYLLAVTVAGVDRFIRIGFVDAIGVVDGR